MEFPEYFLEATGHIHVHDVQSNEYNDAESSMIESLKNLHLILYQDPDYVRHVLGITQQFNKINPSHIKLIPNCKGVISLFHNLASRYIKDRKNQYNIEKGLAYLKDNTTYCMSHVDCSDTIKRVQLWTEGYKHLRSLIHEPSKESLNNCILSNQTECLIALDLRYKQLSQFFLIESLLSGRNHDTYSIIKLLTLNVSISWKPPQNRTCGFPAYGSSMKHSLIELITALLIIQFRLIFIILCNLSVLLDKF